MTGEPGYPHAAATDEEIDAYERGAAARWRGDLPNPLGDGCSLNVLLSVLARVRADAAEVARLRAGVRALLDDAWVRLPADAEESLRELLAGAGVS